MKLYFIVIAQFCGTSLWFAGNAVMGALSLDQLHPGPEVSGLSLAAYTSAVQAGFIAGTFVFSILALADRFRASVLFLVSSIGGAVFNAAIVVVMETDWIDVLAQGEMMHGRPARVGLAPALLVLLRLATGFALAGIYPVGMKLAARHYPERAGQAIGYLVGALVLGTAFPHLVSTTGLDWRGVLLVVSLLALFGGLLVWLGVGEPPAPSAPPARFRAGDLREIFRVPGFRAAAFGYFGHMWELYAFWASLPAALLYLFARDGMSAAAGARAELISFWSFAIIAAGVLGCVGGGLLSRRYGSARVAFAQLAGSGLFCLASPLVFAAGGFWPLALLLVWGVLVVGDSPQFSALAARTAPATHTGTALTAVTGIGFALTIPSIQLLGWLLQHQPPGIAFLVLAPGPLLGLWALRKLA